MKAHSAYTVKSWVENPIAEHSPMSHLTRASVEYELSGEIEGTALVQYLMFYSRFDSADPHNSAAEYVGLIRFQGKVKDKSGSFILRDTGSFEGGTASSALTIVEASGTGGLEGISGTGSYRADREGFFFELDYRLP